MVDENTKKCISIAVKPGKTGLIFHNAGYDFLGLNYVYLPLQLGKGMVTLKFMNFVRENFRGCGVSMPHKESVIPFLDKVDSAAEKIGAVNTIVNDGGILTGYNTDYFGAKKAIEIDFSYFEGKGEKVLLLGAGGAGKAVAQAFRDLECQIYVANRTEERAREIEKRFGAVFVPWNERVLCEAEILVNATRVGFDNIEETPMPAEYLKNFGAVMDVVVTPTKSYDTRLIRDANKVGLENSVGRTMTTYQSAEQFRLYTGKELPKEFLEKFL